MTKDETNKLEEAVLAHAAVVGGWKGMLVMMAPRFLLRSTLREVEERMPTVVGQTLEAMEALKTEKS